MGVNEGVNFTPRGQISPMGAKFTPRGEIRPWGARGEVKNGPQGNFLGSMIPPQGTNISKNSQGVPDAC
jgi:hypothetical protein